jgi:hypothetical protein
MREYFIRANSFAAPFFSDTSEEFVKAPSAQKALDYFVANYKHPCGLYAARAYASADLYHKNPQDFIAEYLSQEAEFAQVSVAE